MVNKKDSELIDGATSMTRAILKSQNFKIVIWIVYI